MEQNSSLFQGRKAEEKNLNDSQSYLSNFGSYFQNISSYFPKTFTKQLPHGKINSSNISLEEKDTILWVNFDYLEIKGERELVLILTYINGFQIWNITNQENIHEILSKREGSIKFVKILPEPTELDKEDNPFYGKRPLLAVASNGDNESSFSKTMVKLFSIRTNEYINTLRFRTEVYNIVTSKRSLVVGLKNHIYGFDSRTMEKMFYLECYPISSLSSSVLALGTRWLAYPGNQPLVHIKTASTSDKIVEVAKDFANGLISLGQKTISEYMYHTNETSFISKNSNIPETENFGTVIVYDIITGKTIAHFRAHSQPISVLSFDPSGVLLVTASTEGHNFHVFQITPNPGGNIQNNYRHLYKLQRGLTNATIQCFSFSSDSRWLAVNSTRGTTHIFAINPTGGPVNSITHIHSTLSSKNLDPIMYTLEQQQKQQGNYITLQACNRIKQNFFEEKNKNMTFSIISSTFIGNPFNPQKILIINQFGVLTLYKLIPHEPSSDSDLEPYTLQLSVEPTTEWDVCRRTKWPELSIKNDETKNEDKENKYQQDLESYWLSNVEILTHSPQIRPLWAHPQFTFKIFQLETNDKIEEIKKSFYFLETLPTKKIEVRYNDPMPFKEYLENGDTKIIPFSSELYNENLINVPSAPPISEDILKAMSTPMENESIRDNNQHIHNNNIINANNKKNNENEKFFRNFEVDPNQILIPPTLIDDSSFSNLNFLYESSSNNNKNNDNNTNKNKNQNNKKNRNNKNSS